MTRWMLALTLVVGCSSNGMGNDDDDDDDDDIVSDPDASVPVECTEEPCLDPPANGFQVRNLGRMIQSGQDIEYCEAVLLPGDSSDTYYVNRFESVMTDGSHHLIITAVEPGSATEANIAGPGDTRTCTGARVFGEDLLPVTGNQQPYHQESFPEGVGRIYTGGQYLIFDYHYLNTTDGPLQARAAVNFHLVDEADVQHVARSFGFYNFGIYIPAGQTGSFTEECRFDTDVMVHKLTRHTHEWGTDFSARYAGGNKDGELIWTTPNYETDVDHFFPEPIRVNAGDGFSFQCDFDNTTSSALRFGVKATDEMCILFGTWWEVSGSAGSQSCQIFPF